MSTDASIAIPPRQGRQPSPIRRRIRKLGRIGFYLLLLSCPFAAGSRPTWSLGLFALAWLSWFVLFLLPQYLRRGVGGRPLPAIVLAAIGGWALIQGFWPHAPYDGIQWPPTGALSVDPWSSLQQGMVFLSGAAIFAGASWMVDSSERIRALLLTVALSGAIFATMALALATSTGSALDSVSHYLPEFQTAKTAIRATYSNQDRFAALLLLTLPCILGLWISLHFTSWRRDGPPNFRTISRDFRLTTKYTLYWLGITVISVTLFLTGCRTTAVSCALSAFILILIYGRKILFKRSGNITFFTILTLLIGQQILFGLEPVAQRFANLDVDWETRWRGWGYGLNLIGERPFLGWGAGAFGSAVPHLPNYNEPLLWNHAHNQYLEYGASLGLPAALALLVGLVWWGHEILSAMRHLRSRRRVYLITILWAVSAILLTGLVDVPLYEPANFWILLALMGAGWGVAARPNEPLSPDEPPPSLLSWQEAHVAESASPHRPTYRLPRWTLLVLLPLGFGSMALSGLLLYDGLIEVRVRSFIEKSVKATEERWNNLLENRLSANWNARPAYLMSTLGLERHLGGGISPADQLFEPPTFSSALLPSRLESPYRIRKNLTAAIRIQPLNGDLYFQLALLDYLQRMPSADKAASILPTLHPDLLRDLLKRLQPEVSPEMQAQRLAMGADELVAEVRAHPAEQIQEALIAEQIVLPRETTDWRIQCMRHLAVASDYSRGFARMQLFCGMLRLHLWHQQKTGDAELQRCLSELHTAFRQNSRYMRIAIPMLFFLRIDHALIDQSIPDTPLHHKLAAAIYREWDFSADAMRHYDLTGDDPDIPLFKGALFLQQNDPDNAVQQFHKFLSRPPADHLAERAARIHAVWRTAAPEAALRFWLAQAEKYPVEKCWRLYIGYAYDQVKDTAKAYEYLEKACEDNDSEGLRLRLAALAPGPESKIMHLRKALVFQTDNIYARANLVLLLKEIGNNDYILERNLLQQSVQSYQDTGDTATGLPEIVQRALLTP